MKDETHNKHDEPNILHFPKIWKNLFLSSSHFIHSMSLSRSLQKLT